MVTYITALLIFLSAPLTFGQKQQLGGATKREANINEIFWGIHDGMNNWTEVQWGKWWDDMEKKFGEPDEEGPEWKGVSEEIGRDPGNVVDDQNSSTGPQDKNNTNGGRGNPDGQSNRTNHQDKNNTNTNGGRNSGRAKNVTRPLDSNGRERNGTRGDRVQINGGRGNVGRGGNRNGQGKVVRGENNNPTNGKLRGRNRGGSP